MPPSQSPRLSRPVSFAGSGAIYGRGYVGWWLSVEQGHLAEQVEVGASVHEPFEVLDLAVLAFEGAAAVGQGQPGGDGLLVAADAAGEGVQVGLVVGFDGGDPVVEAVAVQAGEDLGELGDVPGECVQVRAAPSGLREFDFLVVVEVVRVGGDPPGQVTGLGRPGTAGGAAPASRNGST